MVSIEKFLYSIGLASYIGLKIFPLYINVLLGFISSRFLNVRKDSIAAILIYIIGPVVFFTASYRVSIDRSIIFTPLIILFLGFILSVATYIIGGKYFKDSTLNILSFSAGTGNTGYFGIPLAFMLFDEKVANMYVFAVLGSLLYESTIGFFIIAKGSYTVRDSIIRVLKLPAVYAMFIGLIFNIAGIKISKDLLNYLDYFKGAYAIIGMMMIGMSLSGITRVMFDKVFILTALIIKFIIFPLIVILLINFDKLYLKIFSNDIHKLLFLFSIPPMAGNVVAIASLLKSNPEKAAIAVIISTIISIITIPIMVAYFMP